MRLNEHLGQSFTSRLGFPASLSTRVRLLTKVILLAIPLYLLRAVSVQKARPLGQNFSADQVLSSSREEQEAKFWCYDDASPWEETLMQKTLLEFMDIYDKRPLGRKIGGMGFDHSFYLWFTLKRLQPEFIVESGIFEGHTTWIIKQACPNAKVISIDPRGSFPRTFDGVTYMTGGNFTDFNAIPWSNYDFTPEKSFVLFDDHMSGMRRSLEAYAHGFGHIMFDDNYFGTGGDNYSLRKICDQRFEVDFTDMFAKIKKKISRQTRKKHNVVMRALIKTYYEFPPVLSTASSQTTRFKDSEAKSPLINTKETIERIINVVGVDYLKGYTYMCYAELDNH